MNREDDAGQPRQRMDQREIAMIVRRMASDAVSHANGLGSIARMLERSSGSGPVPLGEVTSRVVARILTGKAE